MKLHWLCILYIALAASPALGQAEGSNSVLVRLYTRHLEQHLKITARGGSLTWRLCKSCPAHASAELTVEAAGRQIKLSDGTLGDRLLVEGDVRIVPPAGEGLPATISAPLDITAGDDSLVVLARMPMEDYVAAALAGEAGNFKNAESLKAMAVAIRSYAVRFAHRHQSEGFDFCDNTHCQNLNLTARATQVRAAVDATRGQLLWYQGQPAATYYHQNCGGTLAAGQEVWPELKAPYLRQHEDSYCRLGAPLPWKTHLTRSEIDASLRRQGLTVPQGWTTLTVVARTPSGRAQKLAFRGAASAQRQEISASSFRFAIGRSLGWNRIRSDLYQIEPAEDGVIFSGAGAGHGVGLCQAGAEEMARQGQNYKQILEFYYPGTKLGVSAQGIPWQKKMGKNIELWSTQPEKDADILAMADTALDNLQSQLGWKLDYTPRLRIFPTLDTYRDATGQPGWIAAYTQGRTISLQPVSVLQQRSALEDALRHELAHLLVEARARAETPLWFREGLVLYLTEGVTNSPPVRMPEKQLEDCLQRPPSREALANCYAAARTRVLRMVQESGRETVLRWLSDGLPISGDRNGNPPQH